jgi:hypothetical protein
MQMIKGLGTGIHISQPDVNQIETPKPAAPQTQQTQDQEIPGPVALASSRPDSS